MAENTTEKRQVILDFDLNAAGALKQAAELDQQLKQLKAEQKALDQTTEEGRLEYQRYNAEIKVTSDQLRTVQTQIANTQKANSASTGEVDKQRAKLAALTAEWRLLKKEDADYEAKNAALQRAMGETTAELKIAEEAHGDNRRSVGDYEKAAASLRSELNELTEQLIQMSAAGETGSEEFNTLLQRAQELKDAQKNVSAALGEGADDTQKSLDILGQSISGVIAAYGLYQSAAAAVGVEDEELEQTIVKLQVAYTALMAVEKAQVAIQKESTTYIAARNLLQKVGINQAKAQAAAEAALNTIRGKGNVITKAGAAVTWLWNAALAANPVVLLVLGVAALVAGLAALFKAFDKSADASKAAAKAQKEYEDQSKKTDLALKELSQNQTKEANELALANKERITALKKRGATAEEIARAEFENAKKVRDMEIKQADERIAKNEALVAAAKKNIAAQEALLGTLREGSKRYKEQEEKIDDLKKSYLDLLSTYESDVNAKKNAAQEQADAEIEYQKQVADATYNRLLKTLDQQKAVNESRIKAEAGYLSTDFSMKQQYAKRVQDLNTQSELQRITLARKYNKITEAEYKAQLAVLNNAMQEFANRQAQEANDYYIAQRKAILSMFDQTAQEQIDEVNKKYEKALEQLKNQTQHAPDASAYAGGTDNADYQKAQKEYEDFLFRQTEIELRLEKQKQKEIAEIQKNSLRERAEEIEKEITEQYDGDLRRYQANERKKTEITIEQLKAQKAAKEKEGLDTYDEDAQLLESQRRLNQMDLDLQLLAAGENARAIYEAKKRYIDEERKLAEGNLGRQAELNAESLANEQEYMNARIAEVEKWANASMQLMSGVNDLFSALDERRLQQVQETYDQESAMLQEKLDKGLISQEVYDQKQKELDEGLEKEQKKIAREQAKREKAMAIFQVILDTSLGIMNAIAASPLTGGLPWSAIVGTMGAIQLATVIAQPLPKAARGRKIKGKSHAQGGEIVEAEDGEIIMNKRSVSMFEPLLSEISVAGGGIPFSSHIPDGGYTARWAQSNSGNIDELREAMSDAVKDLKIYTAITDIRRENGRYTTVESRGTF